MDANHSILISTLRPERDIRNRNFQWFLDTCYVLFSNSTGVCSHDKLTVNQGWGLPGQFSPFRYFPIFSEWIKTVITCMISSSYLAGVTAAELWRHLANMNMIEIIWLILLLNQTYRNGETFERSFSNPHPSIASGNGLALTRRRFKSNK